MGWIEADLVEAVDTCSVPTFQAHCAAGLGFPFPQESFGGISQNLSISDKTHLSLGDFRLGIPRGLLEDDRR